MGSAKEVASSGTKTTGQALSTATQVAPQVVDPVKDAASSATKTVKQEVRNATQAPSQTVGSVKDTASSVTKTVKQEVRNATQAPSQAVGSVKDTVSPVTKTVKQEVRNATQAPSQAVGSVKDTVSPVTKTVKQEVRNATQPPSQVASTETDGPAVVVPSAIGATPAKTASDSESDSRRAGVRSTARTADSSQLTHHRATKTETDGAKGGAAPTSVKPASAVGTPMLEADASRGTRGMSTRPSQSQGVTVPRRRALVPPSSSRPHADLVARSSSTAQGAQPPSSQNAADGGRISFSLPEFLWPSFLPPPIVLAQWLLYALTALLTCIAVLLASGFWARQRVLKF